MKKPKGFEQYLGEYGECLFDGWCGECVAWGFEITSHMGEEKFEKLRSQYLLECCYPTWYLIVKVLGHRAAVRKYGKVTDSVRGPRGGWKSETFGEEKFISKWVSPEWQERVDGINKPKRAKKVEEVVSVEVILEERKPTLLEGLRARGLTRFPELESVT